MTTLDHLDRLFMQRAISLGRAQLGRTAPNPAVGCVIVKDEQVLAEAATGDGGRPHAEEAVLTTLGERAQGSTAYVTLEPCHTRSNGDLGCSDRLLFAGVKRVVVALEDPHPTARDGLAKLRAAQIDVIVGVCADEAQELVEGFFSLLNHGRPILRESKSGQGFDAEYNRTAVESPLQALKRMGESGLTRVFIRPEHKDIKELRLVGLIAN